MYMRNNRYDKYAKYNIDGFPEHYSGQHRKEWPETENKNKDRENDKPEHSLHNPLDSHEHREEKKEHGEYGEHEKHHEKHEEKEKRDGSLLGNLFKGHKDGKKGGILSGLLNKGDGNERSSFKGGGILDNIELDDLILLAVIFFLLKDGLEDDLILILAIILFSS